MDCGAGWHIVFGVGVLAIIVLAFVIFAVAEHLGRRR
jgi:hypothetical protein